ncbi:MAG: methionyl-tRNA formyltransferase [Anaerolineae bacterium]|nr:methionyl-tRNA formyltransferase [Gemmatimonadaceae bacterium]
MRVLFWGTSAFAVPSLRALSGEGFEVVGVVTQPDRAVGRSRSRVVPPPLKEAAVEEGCTPILQPEKPRGPEFIDAVRGLEPDVSVVISYGHILRKEVIDLPPLGTLNVHASLLPALRGAGPIQAAIRDGFVETGVSIMRMVPELDAGPIILQARTPIAEDETYGELHLRLSEVGALALIEGLTLLSLGKTEEQPQIDSRATYATKIDRAATRVNWRDGCGAVARHIRAYDPAPGAVTTLNGGDVKLFGAIAVEDGAGPPGEVLRVDSESIVVACEEGAVGFTDVQPAGKKRMTAGDWGRGRGIRPGDRFA